MPAPRFFAASPRVRRRRLLQSAGLAGAGLAAWPVLGCGDDDDAPGGGAGRTPSGSTPGSGGGSTPSPQGGGSGETPRRGGTFRSLLVASPPTFEPNTLNLFSFWAFSHTHSRLLRKETGPGIEPAAAPFVGDLAESHEISDDGLRYTFQLNGAAKFHPPVGRAVTADDVVFSYQRFVGALEGIQGAPRAADLISIVDRVEAPDESTVAFTIKRPYFPFLSRMGDVNLLPVVPTEIGAPTTRHRSRSARVPGSLKRMCRGASSASAGTRSGTSGQTCPTWTGSR